MILLNILFIFYGDVEKLQWLGIGWNLPLNHICQISLLGNMFYLVILLMFCLVISLEV